MKSINISLKSKIIRQLQEDKSFVEHGEYKN